MALPLSLQIVLALLLVAVFGATWLLRRRRARAGTLAPWLAGWLGPTAEAEALQLLRPVRLAPGVNLQVVRWGEEELLLAYTANGVNVVARRALASTAPASAPSATGSA